MFVNDTGDVKIGYGSNMEVLQQPLMKSPDCDLLQAMILSVMKVEGQETAQMSDAWSVQLKNFVASLSHASISDLNSVSV